jgi:L-asparagine transporter-like permease
MNKLWKFFQYGYLMIAFICIIEGIVRWNSDKSRSFLFIGFATLITIVFFFKRHFRKKVEKRNSQNK